jgi:hypothetical protein
MPHLWLRWLLLPVVAVDHILVEYLFARIVADWCSINPACYAL